VTGLRVSVVIPTLNAAAYLPDLRRASRMQRPSPPEEVILVESGARESCGEGRGFWQSAA
jgi:glycosyltransferase involved in cell wall biosynthesis